MNYPILYFFKCVTEKQRVGVSNIFFPVLFIINTLKVLLPSVNKLINIMYFTALHIIIEEDMKPLFNVKLIINLSNGPSKIVSCVSLISVLM